MRYDPDFDRSTNDPIYDDTLKRANHLINENLNNINCKIIVLPFGTIFISIHTKENRHSILEQGMVKPEDIDNDIMQIKLDRISSYRSNNENYPNKIMYDDTRWTYCKENNTLYISKFK